MKKTFFIMLFVLFFALCVSAQKNDWQKQIEKIKPLVSTEAEIEKILGKPIERWGQFGKYKTKYGQYDLIYSQGRCVSVRSGKYNVEKGVLMELNFTPKKKIKFESLKIDVSGLRTETVSDVLPPPIIYYNRVKGIAYGVQEGILFKVDLYVPADLSYLRCSAENLNNQTK